MENNKYHILIVDDDDRIRNLLKDYLSENNYIVSAAENAVQAKEKLQYLRFDIIILDVMMPGQNGYDFTKEIKKKIKVPVILLNAKGEVENRIKGLELGADDYLGKPFEPKELLLRVKNIIEKKNKINFEDKFFVGDAEIDLNKMIVKLNSKSKKINNSEKKVLIEMLSLLGRIALNSLPTLQSVLNSEFAPSRAPAQSQRKDHPQLGAPCVHLCLQSQRN